MNFNQLSIALLCFCHVPGFEISEVNSLGRCREKRAAQVILYKNPFRLSLTNLLNAYEEVDYTNISQCKTIGKEAVGIYVINDKSRHSMVSRLRGTCIS